MYLWYDIAILGIFQKKSILVFWVTNAGEIDPGFDGEGRSGFPTIPNYRVDFAYRTTVLL